MSLPRRRADGAWFCRDDHRDRRAGRYRRRDGEKLEVEPGSVGGRIWAEEQAEAESDTETA